MNNFGSLIFTLTMVIVTLWIVKRFLNIFFQKKERNLVTTLFWCIFSFYQIILTNFKDNASIYTTLISIILVFLISISGYQNTSKIKFLYVLLFYVTWSLIEILVFFCLLNLKIEHIGSATIGSVISKIITIIVLNILSLFWKQNDNDNITLSNYIIILFIPLGSIYIATNEFFTNDYHNNKSSIITFSILLLINIIIFDIYSKLSENFILEKEKTVYAHQITMISKNTEEQKKIMEDFHAEKHNLINKLIVLKDLVEHKDSNHINEYLNNMIHLWKTNENICHSGNSLIDSIINFKYTTAKEQNIEFHLNIFIPETLPINECDFGVILGNSLDNAIESVQKCKINKKSITISIGIKKQSLVLAIKNPYEHILKKDKQGNLISTKKDSHRHGYGVNSIKKVAEKYNGEVIVDEKTYSNLFILLVILNIKEI